MKIENKDLDNIFSLVNHLESLYEDKFIRLIYEAMSDTIEIEIVDLKTLETLKAIKYKISSNKEIVELEEILQMYISKEVFKSIDKLYDKNKEK